MDTIYHHFSLNWNKREFRVIEILPGDESSPVECKLKVQSIRDVPDYEALSYVWGKRKGEVEIIVSGRPIRITKSLHEALLQIRWKDNARTLWIDAVCINQQNIPEKSNQIAMMGEIFREAQRVLIWLGKADLETERHLGLIENFVATYERLHPGASKYVLADPFESHRRNLTSLAGHDASGATSEKVNPRPDISGHLLNIGIMDACHAMFALPWWRRVWTVQELVVAHEAVFIWGRSMISWELVQAALRLYEQYSYHPRSELEGETMSIPRNFSIMHQNMSARRKVPLVDIIRTFRANIGTDEKDYVYAFLGISYDFRMYEPQYPPETELVYKDFAKRCIELGHLSILTLAGLHNEYIQDTEMNDKETGNNDSNGEMTTSLPSWIPGKDYFVRKAWPHHFCSTDKKRFFNACNSSSTTAKVHGEDLSLVLEVEGWQIDTVDMVGQNAPLRPSFESGLDEGFDYMFCLHDWEQVMFRKYGDVGECSELSCSSQHFYEQEGDMQNDHGLFENVDYFMRETCALSVSCVLDHWHRRSICATRAWSDRHDPFPDLPKRDMPVLPAAQQTLIRSHRERRLRKQSHETSSYWNGNSYFPSGCGIGEAFCRTILADAFRSWKGEKRLDEAIEDSRCRDLTHPARLEESNNHIMIFPSKDASYPDFVAAFCDSYIPKWDLVEEDRMSRVDCMHCAKFESRQMHVANNYVLFRRSLETAISGRRFFTTKGGLMGLAPAATMPGDSIVLLAGSETPLVLRTGGNTRHGEHQVLVGESYVHGVMDGQLLRDHSRVMDQRKRYFNIK